MRRTVVFFVVIGFVLVSYGNLIAEEKKIDRTSLKTQKEKVSYAIGLNLGKKFRGSEIDIDLDVYLQGVNDGMTKETYLLNDDEIVNVMKAFREDIMEKAKKTKQESIEKNKKEGEAFLAENKKAEGVVTLDSGLQYKIIKTGKGASPGPNDTVSVTFKGTTLDGKTVGSSLKQARPSTFKVNGVIKGWAEALQLMNPGSKWKLFVPSHLAWGEKGSSAVDPNATLILEIELISFVPSVESDKKTDKKTNKTP